jgi:hypothetical protein
MSEDVRQPFRREHRISVRELKVEMGRSCLSRIAKPSDDVAVVNLLMRLHFDASKLQMSIGKVLFWANADYHVIPGDIS